MKPSRVTIQMNAIEQNFHVVTVYHTVQDGSIAFKSVDGTQVCDRLFKCKPLRSTFTWYCFYHGLQGGTNF